MGSGFVPPVAFPNVITLKAAKGAEVIVPVPAADPVPPASNQTVPAPLVLTTRKLAGSVTPSLVPIP